jgi:hypothetical protein
MMGLVARPDGVTLNNEHIILVDDFTKFYSPEKEEEIKIKLLATMAVWKSKKGIYIISKIKKIINFEFDDMKWKDMLCKVKLWAEQFHN